MRSTRKPKNSKGTSHAKAKDKKPATKKRPASDSESSDEEIVNKRQKKKGQKKRKLQDVESEMENVDEEPNSREPELVENNEGTPRDEPEQSESDDVSQFSSLSIHIKPFLTRVTLPLSLLSNLSKKTRRRTSSSSCLTKWRLISKKAKMRMKYYMDDGVSHACEWQRFVLILEAHLLLDQMPISSRNEGIPHWWEFILPTTYSLICLRCL